MRSIHRTRLVVLAMLCALLISGCYSTQLAYSPTASALPPVSRGVALQVVDNRPENAGGVDKRAVGKVRGGFGNPLTVEERSPERVAEVVREATVDALRKAGFEVRQGGGRTLVASVETFWMDGYMGYKTTVRVVLTLRDDAGTTLWNAEAQGHSGGALGLRVGAFTKKLFGQSLEEYASEATSRFLSNEFQSQFDERARDG